MTTKSLNILMVVMFWSFFVFGVMSQCFVSSQLIKAVLQ